MDVPLCETPGQSAVISVVACLLAGGVGVASVLEPAAVAALTAGLLGGRGRQLTTMRIAVTGITTTARPRAVGAEMTHGSSDEAGYRKVGRSAYAMGSRLSAARKASSR